MSHRLDDPSALASLLQQWAAPPEVKTRLDSSGFTTLGLLGHALPSADKEDSFIIIFLGFPALCRSCLSAASLHRLRKLNCLLQKCKHSVRSSDPATRGSFSLPKLCQPRSFCPPCSTPSLPVHPPGCPGDPAALSLMPYRGTTLAVRDPTGNCSARSSKPRRKHLAPRPSSLSLVRSNRPSGGLCLSSLPLAMLDKVHLLVIKRFNDKFLSFALAVPSDGSLRGPSLQEILSADRAVWQAVHALRPLAVHVPNPRAAPADPSVAPPPAFAGANQVPAAKAFDKS